MSVLKNVIIKKILIILMVVILISNFIMPNYVWAKNKDGNKIVNGIFYLFAWSGDAILSLMQKMMMGTGDLKENDVYAIKYSPGIIFSNTVPALDIDFIGADSSHNHTVSGTDIAKVELENEADLVTLIEESNIDRDSFTFIGKIEDMSEEKLTSYGVIKENTAVPGVYKWGIRENIPSVTWSFLGALGVLDTMISAGFLYRVMSIGFFAFCYSGVGVGVGAGTGIIRIWVYGDYMYKVESYGMISPSLYACPLDLERTLTSSAYALQGNISTWYSALRTIALVGLLSVLVYIGIKIILSSASAQNKAKYKNMLTDWIVAICILFILHYIMAFMLNITGSLNQIMKNSATSITDAGYVTDDLMNSVRESVGDIEQNSTGQMAGYTVMYLALVILTGMFTIQYLKRVVFMAFLTMIAPLIALTYPLDKIKDGKAQAFSYWLREYIFNCLIQPVHFLLYTIFITNAITFAKQNILYSVVTLAFFVPAEKIIKEMFGMKSNSSLGILGAAAGGAFMMSMLNKIKSKSPKDDEAGGGKAPSGVRTASRGPIDTNNSGNNLPRNSSLGNNIPGNNPLGNNPRNNPPGNKPPENNPPRNNPPGNYNQNNNNLKQGGYSVLGGLREITGVNRLASVPGKTLMSGAKNVTKKSAGIALGALAGTTMLANEIADGHLFEDPGGALSKAGGAAVAGYAGGNALVGNAAGTIEKNVDKFRKGAMGVEAYNNQAFDKQFFNSDNYKIIAQDPTIQQEWGKKNIKEVAQTFLDNGISDQNIIRSAMQNGVNGDEYKSISSMGVTDVKHYRKVRDKNKHKGLSASQIAARMQIAKNLPERLFNDESGFIRYAKRFGIDNEADARRLFSEIDDFT